MTMPHRLDRPLPFGFASRLGVRWRGGAVLSMVMDVVVALVLSIALMGPVVARGATPQAPESTPESTPHTAPEGTPDDALAGAQSDAEPDAEPDADPDAAVEDPDQPGVAPARVDPRSFEVRMHRSMRVGEAYIVESDYATRMFTTTRVAGRKQAEQTRGYRLRVEARARVLAVDGAGRPTSMAYRVLDARRWPDSEGRGEGQNKSRGEGDPLFELGTEYTVTASGGEVPEVVFTNGRTPEASVVVGLGRMSMVTEPDAATDDALLGPQREVKVGDTWGVRREAIRADMRGGGLMAELDRIDGEVTLVEVTPLVGDEALRLDWNLTVDELPAPPHLQQLPFGAEPRSIAVLAEGTLRVPVDVDRRAGATRVVKRFRLTAGATSQGQAVEFVFENAETIARLFHAVGSNP